MTERISPGEALLRLADGLEKLASSIEAAEGAQEKTASAPAPDYGTLGDASLTGVDPLTAFSLGMN